MPVGWPREEKEAGGTTLGSGQHDGEPTCVDTDEPPRELSRGAYGVLGVSEGASLAAIKRAYRRRSLTQHPDKLHAKKAPKKAKATKKKPAKKKATKKKPAKKKKATKKKK